MPALRASVPRPILLLAEWGDLKMFGLASTLPMPGTVIAVSRRYGRARRQTPWSGARPGPRRDASGRDAAALFNQSRRDGLGQAAGRSWGLGGARAAFVAMALLPGRPLLYNGREVESPQTLRLFWKDLIAWNQPTGLLRGRFIGGS